MIAKKTNFSFCNRVKMHRVEIRCLSIREAALEVGISKATLSRVENGKNPDIFTLGKLCWWMGFSIDQAIIDLMPNNQFSGDGMRRAIHEKR